jgi:hypothetical protein
MEFSPEPLVALFIRTADGKKRPVAVILTLNLRLGSINPMKGYEVNPPITTRS